MTSSSPPASATTKGSVLRALLKFVEEDLTPEQFNRAIAALPEADQVILRQPSILSSQKVSEFVLNRLTVEAARAKGEVMELFARRAGEAELKAAVGIYRFFTFVLTQRPSRRRARRSGRRSTATGRWPSWKTPRGGPESASATTHRRKLTALGSQAGWKAWA